MLWQVIDSNSRPVLCIIELYGPVNHIRAKVCSPATRVSEQRITPSTGLVVTRSCMHREPDSMDQTPALPAESWVRESVESVQNI
jgi:hypothetical protein